MTTGGTGGCLHIDVSRASRVDVDMGEPSRSSRCIHRRDQHRAAASPLFHPITITGWARSNLWDRATGNRARNQIFACGSYGRGGYPKDVPEKRQTLYPCSCHSPNIDTPKHSKGKTMPMSAPKPCSQPGCGVLVRDGTGRCPKHKREAWAKPPTATKRVTGRKLQTMRASLFRRQPLCAECQRHGRVSSATQRDHIIPLAEGGADDDDNVQGLCRDCHDVKSKQESARGRNGHVRVALLPDWLPSPTVPVVVVCGPPGSGKSTYVAGLAVASDLVLDVDDMAAKISGKPLYHANYDERMMAIRERNTRLASLGKPVPFTKVWLIVTAGTPHQRAFWSAKYGELVQMSTSIAECLKRIQADLRPPPEARQRAIEAVHTWQ